MQVKVKKLRPDAVIPQYATPGAAGFDLVAAESVIIEPGKRALVPTGLAMEIPLGFELQVRPRSGISNRTYLRVANTPGTVDSDYRGEICVIVDNIAPVDQEWWFGVNHFVAGEVLNIKGEPDEGFREFGGYPKYTYIIRKGDRIAQGVIAPVIRADFEEVDELSNTERGTGGFGSTGTREIRGFSL